MNPGEAAREEPRSDGVARGLWRDAAGSAPWGLSALLLTAFVTTPYLPMVDLPQHAAQLAVWLRLSDPSFPYADLFNVNLGTPYLTGYVAALLLAHLVGVVAALRFVVWMAAALHLFAFSLLVRRLGHARWLGVFGLPLALGYPFYFGMVSFEAAMPFVLLTLVAALAHREAPTWQRGLVLALALCATVVAHGFAAGVALMMVAPLLLRGEGRFIARLLPLAAPALLWAVWLLPAGSVRTIGATIWEPRLIDLFQAPAMWFAASGADHFAMALGYATLATFALTFGRPSRSLERWAPLVFSIIGFCCFPAMLSGFGPLHPRFAAFMIPALLLAFEPRAVPRSPRLPLFAAALCVCWLAVLTVRMYAFTRETRPFRDFVARMPTGLRVRPIIFERNSEAFPSLPALLHLSAYYLVEKGGLQGYSFAMYPTSVIRYVPSFVPGMGGGAEWHPETFSADAEVGSYDCFLVHSSTDPGSIFGAQLGALDLDFHEDAWWAYRPRDALGGGDPSRRRP